MNVREEDRPKTSCPSRGLGLAAAAIGVGVGAALYYFFSKRPENPHNEGSTSDWSCERPETFRPLMDASFNGSDDSYITLSEHETTDTSMDETDISMTSSESDSYTSDIQTSDDFDISDDISESDVYETGYFTSRVESDSDGVSDSDVYEIGYFTSRVESDSDVGTDWDVTSSSAGVPEMENTSSLRTIMSSIGSFVSPNRFRKTEDEQIAILRQQAFRERSWTLEECSICFDVMLRGQEVMALPCTHNFHTQCILPWLQEKQTCPNCRKVAE